MQNPFKSTVEVKFVKSFTSPVLGNVWVNRVATVKKDQADRWIAGGYAVLNDGKSEPVKTSGHTTIVSTPKTKTAPPPADPLAGLTAAQKKTVLRIRELQAKASPTDKEKKELTKHLEAKAAWEKKEAEAAADKAANEAAEARQARIDVLLDKAALTEEEQAELKKLEAEAFEAEGGGK